MFAFDRYRWKNIPAPLLLCMAALCILGYLVLGSAVVNDVNGAATLRNQLLGFAVGGFLLLFFGIVDYHFWLKLYPLVYMGLVGILGLLFTPLGKTYNNATRWLEIPGLGEIQPSEFAKVVMILFFAWYFDRMQAKLTKTWTVLLALGLFAVPAVLLFLEPDLSGTLIFAAIFAVLFFAAGISYKWLGYGALAMIPVGGFLVWDSMQENPLILKRYMLERLQVFLNGGDLAGSGAGDQQQEAMLAISSGQRFGKGLYNASFESVKNGNFLSEENCDFIFAVVGEEMGFVGSAAVIFLFLLLVMLCFMIGNRARDLAGRLIAVGVGTMIGLEAFINIGVTSGLLPNTGIALPFFSAGRSSLISTMFAMGLVINVALQRPDKNVFDR